MGDNQFADLMHTAFDPLVEDTPELPAWEAIQLERPGPMPATGPRWWAGVAAAAVVLFIGAAMVVGLRLGMPDTATSPASPSAVAELSRGELGPEPRFDTAALGEEMVLKDTDLDVLAAEGALPEILGPDSTRIIRDVLSDYKVTGDPVYMGHSNGFHGLIVHYVNEAGEKQPCLLIAQVVPETRSVVSHGCGPRPIRSEDAPRLHIGATIPEPPSTELPEIHVSSLAEDVSVVALELSTGERYWQRPISGAALITPEQGKPWLGYAITTYDAAGNALDTAVLHDPASTGLEPAAIPSEQDVVVIPAAMGPLAPVDTGAPMTSHSVDGDDVVLITDADLTPGLVEALRSSTAEMLESVDVSPPYSIEAVFSLFGDTHAVVTYGDGQRAHVVVGDHSRTATSAEESWLDVKHGRRDRYGPIVEIAWLGLPDDASYVVADYIGIDNFFETENVVQQVFASSSFSAIPKPDWTQYVTLTAFDTQERAVSSIEVLLDGGTCSAGKVNPTPMDNPDLPVLVDATRRAMFVDAVSCHYGDLVSVATEDGSFFGVTRDALGAELRNMDRRFPIMQEIRDALRFKPRIEARNGKTVYVFDTSDGLELVLDDQGRWTSASS